MICTSPCDWSSPLTRRKTTAMCHEIPLFPNQSCWDSRYNWGRNFMAQSFTIRTVFSFSRFKTSSRHWSCLTDCSWWLFHDWMAWVADSQRHKASSLSSSSEKRVSCTALPISFRTDSKASHWSHCWLCWWSHLRVKQFSVGSLREYTLQWSATVDWDSICTYIKKWK